MITLNARKTPSFRNSKISISIFSNITTKRELNHQHIHHNIQAITPCMYKMQDMDITLPEDEEDELNTFAHNEPRDDHNHAQIQDDS
jgi:hypothetical protein